MEKTGLRIDHLLCGFFVGTLIAYVLLSSMLVNGELTLMLLMFNFLFVFLTFPLNGTLRSKMALLLIGEAICLIWNYVFSFFTASFADFFGETFYVLYDILNPTLNLVWIVTFWSISLTILAKSGRQKVGNERW